MRKIVILASVVFILIIAAGLVFKGAKKQTAGDLIPTPTIINTNLKTFKSSSAMDFTIQTPRSYEITEKMGSVIVSSPVGKIYINVNGTNFSDLVNYLNDLEIKNKFTLSNKKDLIIATYPAIAGLVEKDKFYFIYVQGIVYSISTKNVDLYSDLDQIAQSFKYTP